MQITLILPDDLVEEVMRYTGEENINDSLVTIIEEWLSMQKMKELNRKFEAQSLELFEGVKKISGILKTDLEYKDLRDEVFDEKI